jgi:hypothetical protein
MMISMPFSSVRIQKLSDLFHPQRKVLARSVWDYLEKTPTIHAIDPRSVCRREAGHSGP